jgi:hypothetical protein
MISSISEYTMNGLQNNLTVMPGLYNTACDSQKKGLRKLIFIFHGAPASIFSTRQPFLGHLAI